MSYSENKKTPEERLAEIKELFGPPLVLRSESAETYDKILLRWIACIEPDDFMQLMCVKDLADSTWLVIRYTRHKTLSIENKFQEIKKAQAERAKTAAEKKKAQSGKQTPPKAECEPPFELSDVGLELVNEVDNILNAPPTELEHAQALERGITYHLELDYLHNMEISRKNDTLELLQHCKQEQSVRESMLIMERIHDAQQQLLGDEPD